MAHVQLLDKAGEADELRDTLATLMLENERLIATAAQTDSQLEAVRVSKEAQASDFQEVLQINAKLSKVRAQGTCWVCL